MDKRRRASIVIAAGLVVAACTGSADQTTDSPASAATDGDPASPAGTEPTSEAPATEASAQGREGGAACDNIDRVSLVRERSVPGGRQLHIALGAADGTPVAADRGSCLSVSDERLGLLEVAHGEATTGDGATLIVARRNPADVDASREFVDALIDQRPDGELIAVWSWTDDIVQVVGATTDRDRIRRRLDAVWQPGADAPLDAAEVADVAAEDWEQLAEGSLLGRRTVVFVAPTLDLGEVPDIDRDVVTDFWVVGGAAAGRDLGARVVSGDAPTAAAADISNRLGDPSETNLVVVGFCDDGDDLDLTIFNGDVAERSFGTGDAADEHKGVDCTPESALAEAPLEELVLSARFDPQQREVYQSALAQLAERADLPLDERFDRDDDIEWTATMEYGDPLVAAVYDGKFRGQSTLGCERRSRSIDLDGADARHLLSDSGTDEFTLISLCADAGYVRQIIGQTIMKAHGLWELRGDTVEFQLDGVTQGVYLLNERLPDELRNDRSRLTSVIRRDYDVAGQPNEVDVSGESTDEEVLARYDSIFDEIDGVAGDELVAVLETRLDLTQYLRWIAVNTALQNGDYVDEVYFVGEEAMRSDGSAGEFFTIHAWDPDGLFTPCHRDGRLAIDDPNGLLYCTESLLDRAIFADPVVYERYVGVLESVLEELDREAFESAALAAASSVTRWLDDVEVAAAMNEFPAEVEALDGDVGAFVDAMTRQLADVYDARRSELLDAVAAYRAN